MPDIDTLLAAFMGSDPDARKEAADMLAELTDSADRVRARSALLAALESQLRDVRISAAEALGNYPDAEIVQRLCDVTLHDEYVNVRQAAARALGDTASPDAVPALLHAIGNDELKVVRAAAKSLGQAADPRGFEALAPLALQDNPPLAQIAVDALAAIGDDRAIPVLLAGLRHRSWLVRQAAARALLTFQDERIRPALEAALSVEKHKVARYVIIQARDACPE